MAIYEKSRYGVGLNIYYNAKEDKPYVEFPTTSLTSDDKDYIYEVGVGESLDFLANQFYGDPRLKWIILYANPRFTSELEIQAGDYLNIPRAERIGEIVAD